MFRKVAAGIFGCAGLLVTASALAVVPPVLCYDDPNLIGGSTKGGQEGCSDVLAAGEQITIPKSVKDKSSVPEVLPLKIVKEFDPASATLRSYALNGQTFNGRLKFFQIDSTGTEVVIFEIIFENATIAGVEIDLERNDVANENSPTSEQLTLLPEDVTWNAYDNNGILQTTFSWNVETGMSF